MTNIHGDRFRVVTWGESHGLAVGAVIDGCPAGLALAPDDLRADLDRDVPFPDIGTTRREPNRIEILSGVYEGRTLGTPILLLVRNEDVRSDEYLARKETPRPGHSDLTWRLKYGHVDPRGGGRASGRECIGRVAAGAVAKRLIAVAGVSVRSEILELAGVPIEGPEDLEEARARVREVAREGDTTGGVVRISAEGVPPGVGEPVFGKLTARIGHAMYSIGGVKSLGFGAGRDHARATASEANDPIVPTDDGPRPKSNRAGGTLGGITTGLPIVVDLAVKPPPSLHREQDTVDLSTGRPVRVRAEGRFDLNIAPRVAVIGEAMLALVLADAMLSSGHLPPVRLPAEDAS